MNLDPVDITILVVYAIGIFALAHWVSLEKGTHQKDAQDYFLASRALPWWAIGTSLIAANISAEQIVGMSGSGYVMGMAIASYEWMAALTLIVVGKWILPVFLKNGIYTMPEFLEKRYSPAVRNVMAVFWLALYIFVNLTSILWLGALAVNAIAGLDIQVAITALALFALLYALYGGLKAVALTDIVQVSLLVLGGIIITYIALDKVSDGAGGTTEVGDGGPPRSVGVRSVGRHGCSVLSSSAAGAGTDESTAATTDRPDTWLNHISGLTVMRWESTGSATALTSSGVT